ncbi:hypothetical protein FLONG3_1859 [Fusarium longipes]|uniref:SRR1-like domain-containing protein n=1 Tax=Fusarium longipes TaxID=694270 RepID=A0A395T5U7_9HYPO|nr:hypothetical protein FLONG3_1859 [Fusarium longipes]
MRHSKQTHIAESGDKQYTSSKKSQSSKRNNGSSGKQLQQLTRLYEDTLDLYSQSALAKTIQDMLRTKNSPRITKIVSLGLGSLLDAKDQQRRIKQLVMLMAVASHLKPLLSDKNALQIYAQDPTFTVTDETFLTSLGIVVLKTPSIADLGEAGRMMDEQTLVYSPFLTLETYKLLLSSSQTSQNSVNVPMLVSDDFNALRLKWDKRTSERKDVEALIQGTRAGNYRRRAVNGEGFWSDLDRPFPLALYLRQSMPRDLSTSRNAIPTSSTSGFSQFEQRSIPVYA